MSINMLKDAAAFKEASLCCCITINKPIPLTRPLIRDYGVKPLNSLSPDRNEKSMASENWPVHCTNFPRNKRVVTLETALIALSSSDHVSKDNRSNVT